MTLSELKALYETIHHSQIDAFKVFYKNDIYWRGRFEECVRAFEDAYQGEYETMEGFVWELIDEGVIGVPEGSMRHYFDAQAFAHDLELSGDYMFLDGFVFSNHY